MVLTAFHVVNEDRLPSELEICAKGEAKRIIVGVGPSEDPVMGEVLVSDSARDLAVIHIKYPPWLSGGRWTAAAPRILDVVYWPVRGARAYALGCPMGACWAPPLEGRIARVSDEQIYVRIPYPTDGESGGALVDERGVIIGVFAGLDNVGLQSVLPWNFVLAWLDVAGIQVNIPRRKLEQTGELWGEIQLAPLSSPARRPDGSRAPFPTAFHVGVRVHQNVDLVAGLRSITGASITRDNQLPDGFSGSYTSLGARYTRPISFGIGGGRPPLMIFYGVSFLFSNTANVYVLEAIPDSFDLRTGEQAYHLVDNYLSTHGGWSATAGIRLYFHRGMSVRGSLNMINLNLPPTHDRFRRHSFLELGIGLTSVQPIFMDERGP
jgi:hypothetical protein